MLSVFHSYIPKIKLSEVILNSIENSSKFESLISIFVGFFRALIITFANVKYFVSKETFYSQAKSKLTR